MNTYRATEYSRETLEETGRVEFYRADNATQAMRTVLYTHKLHNGNANFGPSGRVIYCGTLAYAVTLEVRGL